MRSFFIFTKVTLDESPIDGDAVALQILPVFLVVDASGGSTWMSTPSADWHVHPQGDAASSKYALNAFSSCAATDV
jgi:hypothetical protein